MRSAHPLGAMSNAESLTNAQSLINILASKSKKQPKTTGIKNIKKSVAKTKSYPKAVVRPSTSPLEIETHKCSKCGKIYGTAGDLMYHMNRNHGPRHDPFLICPVSSCGKELFTQEEAGLHFQWAHKQPGSMTDSVSRPSEEHTDRISHQFIPQPQQTIHPQPVTPDLSLIRNLLESLTLGLGLGN